MKFQKYFDSLKLNIFSFGVLIARGGGGGHGGGGGGGGGGHGSGGSFRSYGSGINYRMLTWKDILITTAIIFGIISIIVFLNRHFSKKQKQKVENQIVARKGINLIEIDRHIFSTFLRFQKDWGDFNIDSIKTYLSEDYFKKVELQLEIIKKAHRINEMKNVKIQDVYFVRNQYERGDVNKFSVSITAQAEDNLINADTGELISKDNSHFTEIWHFKKEGKEWKLDGIFQEQFALSRAQYILSVFAFNNNSFYDSNFGLLSLPDKGSIFNKKEFGRANVTNHVAGRYNNESFEIYHFQNSAGKTFLVSQVYIDTPYEHLVVKKKGNTKNLPTDIELADVDNWKIAQKYSVYMSPSSYDIEVPILNSQFMKRLETLPKDFTIEILDSYIVCYTKESRATTYEEMFDITKALIDAFK
jgi:hypothetical protein